MFREMRRAKQLTSAEDTRAMMTRCSNGVLACLGDDDYPYSVPLNFVYLDNKIYFHSAKAGHKIDAILKHPKVSFTVIDEDTIVSEKFTSLFRSAVAFGKARIAESDERLAAFKALIGKYSGDQPEDVKSREAADCAQSYIIVIDIEHLTGKEAKEYANARNA